MKLYFIILALYVLWFITSFFLIAFGLSAAGVTPEAGAPWALFLAYFGGMPPTIWTMTRLEKMGWID